MGNLKQCFCQATIFISECMCLHTSRQCHANYTEYCGFVSRDWSITWSHPCSMSEYPFHMRCTVYDSGCILSSVGNSSHSSFFKDCTAACICHVVLNYLSNLILCLQTALYPIKPILETRKHNLGRL